MKKTSSGLNLAISDMIFFLCYYAMKKSNLALKKVLMLKNPHCKVLCIVRAQVMYNIKIISGPKSGENAKCM